MYRRHIILWLQWNEQFVSYITKNDIIHYSLSKKCTLLKLPKFHLISWWGNFLGTLQKLCITAEFPHAHIHTQRELEIRWNFGILCSSIQTNLMTQAIIVPQKQTHFIINLLIATSLVKTIKTVIRPIWKKGLFQNYKHLSLPDLKTFNVRSELIFTGNSTSSTFGGKSYV